MICWNFSKRKIIKINSLHIRIFKNIYFHNKKVFFVNGYIENSKHNMKSWEQFLNEKSDGRKPYSQLTKDYYLYMQEEDVPNLPDYGFLLSFYKLHHTLLLWLPRHIVGTKEK